MHRLVTLEEIKEIWSLYNRVIERDVWMYSPTRKIFVFVEPGTGDNLLPEDYEFGYNDYCNFTAFKFERGEWSDVDGGMLMFNNEKNSPFEDPQRLIDMIGYELFMNEDDNDLVIIDFERRTL